MKTPLQAVAVLTAVAIVSQPLTAWDGFGHMAVASVAYRKLNKKTRARVDKLLALNPYFSDPAKWPALIPAGTSTADRARLIFVVAATWPDAIKSDSKYHNDGSSGGNMPDGPEAARNTGYDDFNRHKYWHFVDLPFSQDGTSTASFQVPAPNAETQIAAFRAVLKSKTASDELKSYDLVWLLHILGDVHQPLHASTRLSLGHLNGDTGGNDVPFCATGATTCNSELHAFWDNILGTGGAVTPPDQFAATLVAPSVKSSDIADADKWVQESFSLSKSSVYVNPPVDSGAPPFRATADYTTKATAIGKERVARAGARLAKVLKADLK